MRVCIVLSGKQQMQALLDKGNDVMAVLLPFVGWRWKSTTSRDCWFEHYNLDDMNFWHNPFIGSPVNKISKPISVFWRSTCDIDKDMSMIQRHFYVYDTGTFLCLRYWDIFMCMILRHFYVYDTETFFRLCYWQVFNYFIICSAIRNVLENLST